MFITAERLKQLRKDKGNAENRKITQHIMAEELNIPRGTIASWEADGSGIKKYEDILLVCKYFDIPTPAEIDKPESQRILNDPDVHYGAIERVPADDLKNWVPYVPNVEAFLSKPTHETIARADQSLYKGDDDYRVPDFKADLIVDVVGKNMIPKYYPGTRIGISRVDKDLVMFGFTYCVMFTDGQVHLFTIRAGKDEDHWRLVNANAEFDDRSIPVDKVRETWIVKYKFEKELIQ